MLWKNLVLASPSFNQSSMDFCHCMLILMRDNECKFAERECNSSTSSSKRSTSSPLASIIEIRSCNSFIQPSRFWVWFWCQEFRCPLICFNFSLKTYPAQPSKWYDCKLSQTNCLNINIVIYWEWSVKYRDQLYSLVDRLMGFFLRYL